MKFRAQSAILATGAVLLAGYVAAMIAMPKPDGRVVFGDATHHFVQLRSMVYDGDLDFRNEYARLYQFDDAFEARWMARAETSTGLVRNYMPIGPALLWAPLYLLLSALQLVASWIGLAAPPDGFSRLVQMAPGISGVIAATIAALIAWRCARTHAGGTAAALAVFGVWIGSHAVYYSLVSPSYSHAASMLTASLFVQSWLGARDRPSVNLLAVWGGLAGLAALMRWQDAVFVIIPVIEALRWRVPMLRRLLGCVVVGMAFTLAFSPQMLVWQALYGQLLSIPQGPSFMQWTQPHLWDVLFSDNHGLFTWAPILIPAVIGLVSIAVSQPAWRLPLATVVLLSWYVNAAVADWWAGEAFGARRFLSLFPLFVLGLARWLDPNRLSQSAWRLRIATVVVLGALNWLLLLQYQIFMKGLEQLASYPLGAALWFDRFAVPFRLFEWWMR